ncbi:rab-GTPase-TBC domain-containing protein [Circinella umbellata]|nr:rab-GTPase-TBC domain-containing protein [Circinella umbellata]
MRLRSSSFTNSSSTETSQRHITNGLFPTATASTSSLQQSQQIKHRHGQGRRQPSLESSTTTTYSSAGQNLQPFNTNHSSNTTTSGSLLTVDGDIHASTTASSVDTLSDDEDEDDDEVDDINSLTSSPTPFSPPLQQQSKLAALAPPPLPSKASVPISQSPTCPLQTPAPIPKASVSRSISNAFKDKLTLSRKKVNFHYAKIMVMLVHLYYMMMVVKQLIHLVHKKDQYGFIKGSQWISVEEQDNFEKIYQPVVNRRQQKWRRLIAENNGEWPQPSSKFKRFIRKGIPADLRGQAWLHYSGAETKKFANPGVYRDYVERAEAMGLENEFLDIIERDLHRTFPDNIRFKSTPSPTKTNGEGEGSSNRKEDVPAIQSLRRILSAFSIYAPEIGYCQSLNYIAGLLLLFMNEEDAFWTFVVLVQDILPPNIYDVTMEGANIDQTVLMMLLSERCPHIWNRMSSGKSFWECEEADGNNGMPTTTLVTSHWFLTLFINILPIESVLRVWDCLFYEGQRVLFRVALAIFKMNEREVLAVNDSLEIFQVIQNMPKRMVDCHKLLEAAYEKYASVTRVNEQDLRKRRELIKNRRDERRKNTPHLKRRLKRGTVRGTIIHKAMEARRLVERAKTVRR